MPESLIGQVLGGDFEITRELGRGGMSTIYLGQQLSVDRTVAVKVLEKSLLGDPNFMERFSREVATTAKLQHPHIIPIYSHGQHEGMPYVVMAYVPGGSLQDRMWEEKPVFEEIANLFIDICQALDYAHEQGVIHRDIKPANILIDRQQNAILTDFGIAHVATETQQQTGEALIGTLSYIAPEMITPDNEIVPAVDIYALGVTLYQVLTGELPFRAKTAPELMWSHLHETIPLATLVQPDLPPAVDAIIHRAMAKDPAHRYPSAGEFAADLKKVIQGQAPSPALSGAEFSLTGSAPQLVDNLEWAVRRVIDQVVKVMRPDGGIGSGFYLMDDNVMTALHVVDGAPGIAISFRTGERIEADVVAAGAEYDLALLKLRSTPTTLNKERLDGMSFEQAPLDPGEALAAIGHPLGLDWSVTGGHFNGLRQPGEDPLPRFGIMLETALVQVDVAINAGNSGGPIIDAGARLVGVADSIINPAIANNIGFAIASETVRGFWEANRDQTEPLLPYSDGHHHPAGVTHDPYTGKPIKPVNPVAMMDIKGPTVRCSNCEQMIAADAKYCPHCGKPNTRATKTKDKTPADQRPTAIATVSCTNCGYLFPEHVNHCPQCGKARR
jgi:S1-C subfamily serine protease/RNA polymerase subunit RPABC4/transcription elongation factor Spt4